MLDRGLTVDTWASWAGVGVPGVGVSMVGVPMVGVVMVGALIVVVVTCAAAAIAWLFALRRGVRSLLSAAQDLPWPADDLEESLRHHAARATCSLRVEYEPHDPESGRSGSGCSDSGRSDSGRSDSGRSDSGRSGSGRFAHRLSVMLPSGDRQLTAYRSWRRPPFADADRDVVHALIAMAEASRTAARREAVLQQQTSTDALTGLASVPRFREDLRELAATCEPGHRVAVLFLDLDHFKTINTRLGHLDADQVLREVGARIRGMQDGGMISGRFGGDEFLVAFPTGEGEPARAHAVSERLTARIRQPMRVGDQLLQVNVSAGAAVAGREDDVDAVIRQAEAAMRAAKRTSESHGPPRWADERRRVRELLDEREIRVEYQPIVSVATGVVTGFEALLRVTDPELGVISPETLVDSAARTRMLDELALLISEQALDVMRQVSAATDRRLRLAIYLEFEQLRSDNVTLSWLVERFDDAPVDLLLEMTERHSLRWTDAHADVARGLRRHGIELAIDDFGAGYATYQFLDAWDWALVKIDRGLVSSSDVHGQLLLRHVATLLHDLRVPAVAEGIETMEQLQAVARLGIAYAQGYHLGRPMTAAALLDKAPTGWLENPLARL